MARWRPLKPQTLAPQANHAVVRRLVQVIVHNYDDFSPRLPLRDFAWLIRTMGTLGGREWYLEEMGRLLNVRV